jgi:hypothetical protein
MQTGVRKLPREASIVLACFFFVFVSVSCRRTSDIAGKYYDIDKSHESLELNPDGTFYRSLASGGGVTGTYVVNKNEITLKMRVQGTDMGSKGEILESDKGVRVTIMEPNAFGSREVARSFFRPSAAEEARGRKAAEAALDKVIAPLNLMPSPEYPLAGFWRKNCADAFGLAISTAVDKRYTVSFCGPGGCSELRKTAIINDHDFRFIEKDSIEMNGASGFMRWVRCR